MSDKLLLTDSWKRTIVLALIVAWQFHSLPGLGQGLLRKRLQSRLGQHTGQKASGAQICTVAGLQVAVWSPPDTGKPAPLVIFSHGYHGRNTQSVFIMTALAQAGYLVLAPNHKDAIGLGCGMGMPEINFRKASQWNDSTFKDRGQDIAGLIQALQKDPAWANQIDWSKVALCGHSLGGYTVLGLGGAWPSWKLPGIKAVLALSPYCEPFVENGNLAQMSVPVMYQGGTRDLGITPTIKRPQGAFARTSSPAYFVDFDKVGHLSWTGFNKNQAQQSLICHYCLAFLDKFLKGDAQAQPAAKLPGVATAEAK